MVKHIVFWKMRELANGNDMAANIALATVRVDQVAKMFPPLKSITHHRCIFHGKHYWDFVEEMEFETVEALKAWAEFPPHKELHDFVETIRIERAAVDYEF